MPKKTYKVPEIIVNGTSTMPLPYENSILDFMGIPTKVEGTFKINALPIRAYVKIWNEFFRDENVGNAATIKTDDADVSYGDSSTEEIDQILDKAYRGGRCLPVNKFHDYFTSCLPYPQRGPEVTIPMTGNAPIRLGNSNGEYQDYKGPVEMILGAASASNTPGSLVYGNTVGAPGECRIVTGKQIGRAHV